MEPFSALAIATSVVQFVDFGSKLISRAIEIHNSPDDLPTEMVDMAKLNEKMSTITKDLGSSMQSIPTKPLEPQEQNLLDMCQQCQVISLELGNVLKKLQKSTKPGTWESIRTSFQSIMGQKKIEALQSRLDAFRQQLMLNILVALRFVTLYICCSSSPTFLNLPRHFRCLLMLLLLRLIFTLNPLSM